MSGEIDFVNTKPEMINIEDIARGLGRRPHFGGHTPKFFSIAEHCLLVKNRLFQLFPNDHMLQLAGLLHDAAEAYLSDVPSPLKALICRYDLHESALLRAIFSKYGIPWNMMFNKHLLQADEWSKEVEIDVFYKGGKNLTTFTNSFNETINVPIINYLDMDEAIDAYLLVFDNLKYTINQ